MGEKTSIVDGFANQAEYCRRNNAPITARICEAVLNVANEETAFGRRIVDWHGDVIADALPLRAAGALHALHLSGEEPDLAPLYAGEATALANAEAIVAAAIQRHRVGLLPWLDGPPQTNEAGRSSNFVAAMLWLAAQGLPHRFDCVEIGSSAGINLMIDRYRYDLGGVTVGPEGASIRLEPEWRGDPPPGTAIEIASLRGCDISPVDLTDDDQAMRLKAYIWPEQRQRFTRMEAAIALAHDSSPDLMQADAADFVEAQLGEAQADGTTRVLMHSIVWQYLPEFTQQRIEKAMTAAGAQATKDKALAWIRLEADRSMFRHVLSVRYWPGDGQWTQLGTAHAHGEWIEWMPDFS